MEDERMKGCENMIIDGYFRALLSIYDPWDDLGKNPVNPERINC